MVESKSLVVIRKHNAHCATKCDQRRNHALRTAMIFVLCLLFAGCDRTYHTGTTEGETVTIEPGGWVAYSFQFDEDWLGIDFNLDEQAVHARIEIDHLRGSSVRTAVLDKSNFNRFEFAGSIGSDNQRGVRSPTGLIISTSPIPLHPDLSGSHIRHRFRSPWVRLKNDLQTDEQTPTLGRSRLLYLVVENTSTAQDAMVSARLVMKNDPNLSR